MRAAFITKTEERVYVEADNVVNDVSYRYLIPLVISGYLLLISAKYTELLSLQSSLHLIAEVS